VACVALAGLFYLVARQHAGRMVESGHGWEMAFYFSPLVFLAVDGLALVGAVVALFGLIAGPGLWHRVQSVVAALLCVAIFVLVPWR